LTGPQGPGNTSYIPEIHAGEIYRGVAFQNNSTTTTVTGGVTMSTSGSLLAQSVSSTNLATKNIRLRYYPGTTSTGRYTGTRCSALLWYIGGGFRYIADWNISDTAYVSNCQQFFGMAGQTTDLAYGDVSLVLVSTLTNLFGVGSEIGDTNLQIFFNDASGSCTKVDCGSAFPANRTAGAAVSTIYSLEMYNSPGSSTVYFELTNKETGDVFQYSTNTNLPAATQGLAFFASRTLGTPTTNAGQFDLYKLGVFSLV